MRVNGDQSSSHRKTRQSETAAVPSSDETQVKEEEFESLFSTVPVHFDNIGDDDSEDHPLQTSRTTSSLQPSTISRLPSHLDNEDATKMQKLLDRIADLERCLNEEKTAREELQMQNRELQATLQRRQEQHEEMCQQLREYEKQHRQHSWQELVKQEHVDDSVAELQQPLQLQAGQRRENGAGVKVNVDADVVFNMHVKQEALVGDDADDGDAEEVEQEGPNNKSSDGEDENEDDSESGSEEEDSDDQPSKR
jgi:hypothetical protein